MVIKSQESPFSLEESKRRIIFIIIAEESFRLRFISRVFGLLGEDAAAAAAAAAAASANVSDGSFDAAN